MNWSLSPRPTVAIVGATGVVGRELVKILRERSFPTEILHLIASERSQGESLQWGDRTIPVVNLEGFDFSTTDIAFFSAGARISLAWAQRAAAQGSIVIDNTSAFRMDRDCPLIVPEVNSEDMAERPASGIIGNPNCSTIQLVRAIAPIHRAIGLDGVVVSTYQAASGAGTACMDELRSDAARFVQGSPPPDTLFARPLAFNVVPEIGEFDDHGYTLEEQKIIRESRRIMGDPGLAITVTSVRVPVVTGHCEAVYLTCRRHTGVEEIVALLRSEPGLTVFAERDEYATPRFLPDPDQVFVGRVRGNPDDARGVWMWIVADNLRVGAALNAVEIAEAALEFSSRRSSP